MAKRRPTRRKKTRSKARQSSRKGWATRRKRAKAERLGRRYAAFQDRDDGWEVDDGPERPTYPWDRDEGWEPPEGWQGDELVDEISYMTHEEKVEFLEWLAEELDTTVHDLFEMLGSP